MTTGTAALPGRAGLILETEGNKMGKANKPSAEEKKRWLNRANKMRGEVQSLFTAKARSFEQATGITPRYSGNCGGRGSRDVHKFEEYSYIATCAETKAKELERTREEILRAIYTLQSEDERKVLIELYVNYRRLKEIPDELNISESTMYKQYRTAIKNIRITRKMIEKAEGKINSEKKLKQ